MARISGRHVLLLTGPPGIGKTTVIRRVVAGLSGQRLRGFLTEEMLKAGKRHGFWLEPLDAERRVLARIGLASSHHVGRYGVDVEALDGLADTVLAPDSSTGVYVVDEIGKMECLSTRFVAAMERLLGSDRLVVATVAARGNGLIESVKRRPEVELWQVTSENRDGLPAQVLDWIQGRA